MLGSASFNSMDETMQKSTKTSPGATGQTTGSKNKLTLTIIVNGEPVSVEANLNAPLHTVIAKAFASPVMLGSRLRTGSLRMKLATFWTRARRSRILGLQLA